MRATDCRQAGNINGKQALASDARTSDQRSSHRYMSVPLDGM